MGDDETGLSLHQLLHSPLNLLFRLGIHIGGRFVQDEHMGVQQHRPGDGEKLLLPLGQVHAVVVDDGIVALGELGDGVVNFRRLSRGHHLLHRGVLFPVS